MHYSLTRATAWNLVGYIYLLVASFVSTPYLLHGLGLSQFGQYGLIIATLSLVSSINLGLPQAVVRALARATVFTHRQRIWATSSLLFILTGLLAGIVATLLILPLNVVVPIMWLVFATGVINNVVSHYLTLPQSEGHFGYFNTKTFIIGTGNTLVAAYLAWRGQGVLVILLAQLSTYILTLVPLAYFSLKYFPHPRAGKPSLPVAKSLVTFGIKSQIGKIIGQIQAQYGKYLLAPLSPLTLSAYIIGVNLVQKLAGGVVQLATALYPATARSNIKSLYHRLQIGLCLAGIASIWLYDLFGYTFLSWWLHAPDLASLVHSVMHVLIWYFAILIITPLASTIIEGSGSPGVASSFAAVTTVLEISLALLLYPYYGLFAPVYASLIALVLTTPALLYVAEGIMLKSSL